MYTNAYFVLISRIRTQLSCHKKSFRFIFFVFLNRDEEEDRDEFGSGRIPRPAMAELAGSFNYIPEVIFLRSGALS